MWAQNRVDTESELPRCITRGTRIDNLQIRRITHVVPSNGILYKIRRVEEELKSENLSELQKQFIALYIYAFDLAFKELKVYATNPINTGVVWNRNGLIFDIYIQDFSMSVHVTYRINRATLIVEDFHITRNPDNEPPRPGVITSVGGNQVTLFDRLLDEGLFMTLLCLQEHPS